MGAAGRTTDEPVDSLLETDRLACRLAAARNRLSFPLSRSARAMVLAKGWTTLGYARVGDFTRERLDRSGRWLRDLAALAEFLESSPALADAMTGDDGGAPLGRVASLAIGRIASQASSESWIALARRTSVRMLGQAIREAREAGSSWPGEEAGKSGEGEGESREGGAWFREGGAGSGEGGAGFRESGAGERCLAEGAGEPAADPASDLDDDRRLIRLLVPAPLKAAFDEAVDLHRAVCGEETTVASFVEALVAEALAGPHPPDVDLASLRVAPGREVVEEAMARASDLWASLKSSPDEPAKPAGPHGSAPSAGSAIADAVNNAIERIEDLSAIAGTGGPCALDAQLRSLIAIEDEIEWRLGLLLAEMAERGAWGRWLFSGAGHYGVQRLGLGRTTAEDRVRLARSVRQLPFVRRAVEEGRIGIQAALLVCRKLGRGPVEAPVEAAWVARAEEATIKRLRDEVRIVCGIDAYEGGESESEGEGHAAWAIGPVLPPDDATWYESIRRSPGSSHQRIGRFGLAAARLGTADVFLRLRLQAEVASDFLAAVEASRRACGETAESVPWHEPWPEPNPSASLRAARTFSTRCRRVPAWVGLLAMLEDYAATWDDPKGIPKRPSDGVYSRDGWRCTAPGCTSRKNLEDHHVVYRSRGGRNDPSNRICLCRFHHQEGEHGEFASCRGTAPLGIRWRLGREGVGGDFVNERRVA